MRTLLIPAPLFLPALAGCAQPAAEAPDVVATFYPLEFLVERIGSGNVSVASVVRADVEPHDYEPTPADVVRISVAKLRVLQEAGFEGWMETARGQGEEQARMVATEGLDLAPNPDEDETEQMPYDPHTWLDPVLYAQMARNVEEGLATTFPAHVSALRTRLDAPGPTLRRWKGGPAPAQPSARRAPSSPTTRPTATWPHGTTSRSSRALLGAGGGAGPPDARARHRGGPRVINATIIYFEDLVTPRLAQIVAEEVARRRASSVPSKASRPNTRPRARTTSRSCGRTL